MRARDKVAGKVQMRWLRDCYANANTAETIWFRARIWPAVADDFRRMYGTANIEQDVNV